MGREGKRGRGFRPVDRHRMETGTEAGMETRAIGGDGNGEEDGIGDGNEDGIREGESEAKRCKKTHKICKRNQAVLFGMRRHICRQEMALAGTE